MNVVYVMCLCGEFEEVYTHTHTPDIVYYVVYNISAHRVSEVQEGEGNRCQLDSFLRLLKPQKLGKIR